MGCEARHDLYKLVLDHLLSGSDIGYFEKKDKYDEPNMKT